MITTSLIAAQEYPSYAPCAATLNERDVRMFANIGVPIDLLKEAQIERVSDKDAWERFDIKGPISKNMGESFSLTIRMSPDIA